MVEEIWQFCSDNTSSGHEDSDSGEDLCTISLQSVKGTEGAQRIRLRGVVNNTESLMLIDSGSTHAFTIEQLAALLLGW